MVLGWKYLNASHILCGAKKKTLRVPSCIRGQQSLSMSCGLLLKLGCFDFTAAEPGANILNRFTRTKGKGRNGMQRGVWEKTESGDLEKVKAWKI